MGKIEYIPLIGNDNNLDLVEVICTFYMDEFHSNYIIYSLNKDMRNNKHIIHVGKIIKIEDKNYLFNIDNYEEWSKVRNIIRKINDYGLEGEVYE